MEPLRLAIVGLGRWGRNYLKTLAGIAACRVSALVDEDPQVRAALGRETGIPVLADIESLLERSEPDAAIIATPDDTHARLARLCLEAGRDVLVEKPMARTEEDAALLLSLARRRGLVLACGHTALYQAGFAELSDAVRSGGLGRPLRIEAVRVSSGPARAAGSDPLWDLGPHDVAMAISLFGPPARCVPAGRGMNGRSAEFELLFGCGTTGVFRVAWSEAERVRRFSVTGPHGSVTLEEAGPDTPELMRPLARQCLDFIECCRTRTAPQSDGELGREVTRCLERCSTTRATQVEEETRMECRVA